jgi:ferrochelatase
MSDELQIPYDSFLLVSFGGPEGPDDVMPFLENVLRGKNVPRERMLEVAEHYSHFGGVSPINAQNRKLIDAITSEFGRSDIDLPIYWGNRNWHPMLADTIRQMRDDGRRRTLAFFTSMFSSYSGCRQYRENIIAACEEVGDDAPIIDKIRVGFNHPGFIDAMSDSLRDAIGSLGNLGEHSIVLFTAHSIPMAMADGCQYVNQLNEASRLVAEACGINAWRLVYQSRSGPPHQPWLEPDVCDAITEIDEMRKLDSIAIVPIGFVSDHMEVLFDLDEEAAQLCEERNIRMARARTAGTGQTFVRMIGQLVGERISSSSERTAIGSLPAGHDVCPTDCCTYERTRP